MTASHGTNEEWPYIWDEILTFLAIYLPGLLVCSIILRAFMRRDTRAPWDRNEAENFFWGVGLVLWPLSLITLGIILPIFGLAYLITSPDPNALCDRCHHKMSDHQDKKCPYRGATL